MADDLSYLQHDEIRKIPIASPAFVGNEKTYVMDCLETSWVSSIGSYIERFEAGFAEFCGVRHALSVCNGTVALHVALLGLGVGPGDEVIVPTLTYIATANAVSYCGAQPVFVDIEPITWNMDPSLVEEKITPRTKGIIVVHLYGHPVDMDPILNISGRYGLFVLEDAAEAHGAEYKGKRVGSFGHVATFSFYGNKIITTGEGGMIVTDDAALARKMLQLKGQGQDFEKRYWFPIIGYNYRMTNIQAALGLAQLEKIDWHITRHREIATWYHQLLGNHDSFTLQPELPWAKNVYWMNCLLLSEDLPFDRDELAKQFHHRGIETRPFFYPIHTLPPYLGIARGQTFPIADFISTHGLNLPSSANLSLEEIHYIADSLEKIRENYRNNL